MGRDGRMVYPYPDGESGLTQRVKDSRISEAESEHQTLAFFARTPGTGDSPLWRQTVSPRPAFLVK